MVTFLAGKRIRGTNTDVSLTTVDSTAQTGQDSGGTITSNSNREGQVFSTGQTEIGRIPIRVKFKLAKTGSPTGTLSCKIRNSADTVQFTSPTTIDISTLTGTHTEYTFELNTNTYALANGDRITLEPSGGTVDGSNYINIGSKSAAGLANSEHQTYQSSTWSTYSAGYDLYIRVDSIISVNDTFQDGTIFEAIDTNKHYIFNSTTTLWTLV